MSHSKRALTALRSTQRGCFWLDDVGAKAACDVLTVTDKSDLAIVGGGYTGLWSALLAKERDPSRKVVIIEADRCGAAASGRNGGFCESSLTHGLPNGIQRFADELETLERLGRENLDEIETATRRYNIQCEFERTGMISVTTQPWQQEGLTQEAAEYNQYGHTVEVLSQECVRQEVNSPTYLGGLWIKDTTALLHPARLAEGLKTACLASGVQIFENSLVQNIEETGGRLKLTTPYGSITAENVVLATNAFPPLLRRLRQFILPVYDYVLTTEPLTTEQMEAIGWKKRQGLADSTNLFHYYRLTADNRILWGGYDAVYHFGNKVRPDLEHRPQTYAKLAEHFFETFPQLAGEVQFSHAWGGVIDTCSRFCVFFGKGFNGRLAYAAGFTGLGVGTTRFAGNVMLDLLDGGSTELTSLQFVRSKPLPFPPEPLRWPIVTATVRSLEQADRNEGRRNLWLRILDRFGLGFSS